MSAITTQLLYCDAEDALESAETFESAIDKAALYVADDMPADMRIKLSELQAWAVRDKHRKRNVLMEVA